MNLQRFLSLSYFPFNFFDIAHPSDQGKSIIFITHKLRVVLAIADRIMVIRIARWVVKLPQNACDKILWQAMMVGREAQVEKNRKGKRQPGPFN